MLPEALKKKKKINNKKTSSNISVWNFQSNLNSQYKNSFSVPSEKEKEKRILYPQTAIF